MRRRGECRRPYKVALLASMKGCCFYFHASERTGLSAASGSCLSVEMETCFLQRDMLLSDFYQKAL